MLMLNPQFFRSRRWENLDSGFEGKSRAESVEETSVLGSVRGAARGKTLGGITYQLVQLTL